jgi:hypothetical protein
MARNLTLTSPTYGTGKFGQGLSGGYGAISAGGIGSGPVFTWELWFTRSAVPGAIHVLFGAGDNPSAGYIGIGTDGKPQFNGSTGTVTLTGPTNLCDGAWHHLAMVGTSGGFTGYVDGVSIGSSATAQPYSASCLSWIGALDHLGDFTSAGAVIDEVATWSISKYTSSFTPPTSAYTGSETGLIALYHLNGDGTDSAGTAAATPTPTIAPNNAGILYSPCNWDVQTARALSINPGAYFKTLFSGATCVLNFDVSANAGVFPQIYYRIDRGPWVTATIAATVSATAAIPSIDSGWSRRLLEVVIRATSFQNERWAGTASAVRFTGLTLDSGATVAAPSVPALKGIIYGDSITEGDHVHYLNTAGGAPIDQCDSLNGYALELASLLGCELGVIGLGGQGWGTAGAGSVPALPSAYNYVYSGVARTFPSDLSFAVVNMGQNDGSTNYTTTITAWINAIVPQLPATCPLIFLRPLSGNQAANIQAAITASSYASRCKYVDTTGFFTAANSADGVHPYGFENIASIAPKVASALKPIVYPSTGAANSNVPFFRIGFR